MLSRGRLSEWMITGRNGAPQLNRWKSYRKQFLRSRNGKDIAGSLNRKMTTPPTNKRLWKILKLWTTIWKSRHKVHRKRNRSGGTTRWQFHIFELIPCRRPISLFRVGRLWSRASHFSVPCRTNFAYTGSRAQARMSFQSRKSPSGVPLDFRIFLFIQERLL